MTSAAYERIAERILRYVSEPPLGDRDVIELADPAMIRAGFAPSVGLELGDREPAHGDDALEAATDAVIRWSVHTSHPRFLNQNFAGPDPLALAGDWLAAALNTTNATYEVAPVFTLMERTVLRRLASLAGLPALDGDTARPPGLLCAGGSLATLQALQLARHRRDPDLVRRGDRATAPVVFVSDAGHYAAEKSAALLGIGTDSVVQVATSHAGAMLPTALAASVDARLAEGRTPFAVIATAGTTVTAAFDPLGPIADVCTVHDLWLHVDGCYGASALFSPRHRHHLDGVERADSIVWNLHKMMGLTQQCTALLLRDPQQLGPCFATEADYLFQDDKAHGDLDAGDRTFQCGRRVDVLKLWLAWKAHGDDGFAARVDHAVALADHTRDRVAASDGELAAVVAGEFTNVCLTWVPPELRPLYLDSLSAADHDRLHRLAPLVKARMQSEGTAMVGYQPVHGLNVFRLIFMNPAVTPHDVDSVLDLITHYSTQAWPPPPHDGIPSPGVGVRG